MHKRVYILASIVLAAAGGGVAWQMGYIQQLMDRSNGALPACEAVLLAKLHAPSTYVRKSAKFQEAPPLTVEQYADYEASKGCVAADDYDSCQKTNYFLNQYMVNLALAGKLTDNPDNLLGDTKIDRRRYSRKAIRRAEDATQKWKFDHFRTRTADLPETAFVSIEYDADNAYGTPLRSEMICHFGPRAKGAPWRPSDIFLDGSAAEAGF